MNNSEKYRNVKRIFIPAVLLAVLACGVVFPSSGWSAIRSSVMVAGYLVTEGEKVPVANSRVVFHDTSAETLFDIVTDAKTDKGLTLAREGKPLPMDADGFFRFRHAYWFFQSSRLNLTLSRDGGSGIEIPLDLKGRKGLFMVIVLRKTGDVDVYLRDSASLKKRPLVFISGFHFPFLSYLGSHAKSSWKQVVDLLRQDGLDKRFAFFSFTLPNIREIRDTLPLFEKNFRILRRIMDSRPPIVLSYSLGSLALRYYTVSTLFKPGTIEAYLQVAPPNHGVPIPDFIGTLWGEKRMTIYDQFRPDCRFIEALNNPSRLKKEDIVFYKFDRERMGEKGVNPQIRTQIIAGDIAENKKEILKSWGTGVGHFLGRLFGYGDKILRQWGIGTDGFQSFSRSNEKMMEAFRRWVGKIPRGDLIVPLNSALIPGVPHFIMPYNHFDLLSPESKMDARYLKIKRFLLGVGNETT